VNKGANIWSFLVSALAACVTAFAQAPPAGDLDPVGIQKQKQVLVVYSTRRDAQIVAIGDRELPRILEKGLTEGVDYYSEFIDEGRFSQPEYQIAFRDFLDLKYSGRHFDLLIAMGEKPLEFVATHRDELFAGTPLVYFSDLGDRVPNYPNSTGVIAHSNLAGSVTLATALQPDTKSIFVVVGVGADALLESTRRQLRVFEPRIAITYLAGLPTADLDARLAVIAVVPVLPVKSPV